MKRNWNRLRYLLALLTPGWISAQELPARSAVRPELLGCWTISDERGQLANRKLGTWLPDVVLLTTTMDRSHWLEDYPMARSAVRLDSLGRNSDARGAEYRWRASLWTTDSLSDSVRIKFGDGRTGVWLTFDAPSGRSRDTLTGTAEPRSDVGGPRALVPVQATRTTCP